MEEILFCVHKFIHTSIPQKREAILLSSVNGTVHQTLLCSRFWQSMRKDAHPCRCDNAEMFPFHQHSYYIEQFELNLHPWLPKCKGSHQSTP